MTAWLADESADDVDVLTEIELFSELVIAASQSEHPLTLRQIDVVLGVASATRAGGAA